MKNLQPNKLQSNWIYLLSRKALVCGIIVANGFCLSSQTLINQLWEQELNYPDTIPWSASVLSSSNLFTTGNTWHNNTQKVNIVTTKTNSSGTIIWQTEYNGTLSGFDYGAAIAIDGSGNIFVAGATHNTSAYTFDIVIIKYNSSGTQQWATLFDGAGSGMDIPSGIAFDGSGNIYVCGASTGSTTGYDYVTMQLNSSGTIQWTQTYDYASLSDLPGYIAWNSGTSKIGIAGASQSSATNWDYTTLKYNSSGTLTNTNRTTTTGYGFDRPTGLVTDASDNYYITGYAYNGTDYDMRTIKLDEDLSPIWTVSENDGDEDGSNSICIDGSNNVYIAGFAKSSFGNRLIKVVKYNSSGTFQWEEIFQNSNNDIDAEATGITYNSTSGRVTICGFYKHSSGIKIITTFALEANDGDLVWKTDFPNLNATVDVPIRIHENGSFIWVYGTRTEDDTTRYITLKYQFIDLPFNYLYDSLEIPAALNNQLIIRFNPEILNMDFINNEQKQFEDLSEVIDPIAFAQIEPIINSNNVQFTPVAVKVFKHFKESDSLSTSRLGEIIKLPKMWSALIVTIPDEENIFNIRDSLNQLDSIIYYAHPNMLGQLYSIPDDYYIVEEDQESLIGTATFPDGDIDMDAAWDISVGEPYIKLGICDAAIYWAHPEFSTDGSYANSKIEGGYDYFTGADISTVTTPLLSHATSVAGIAAAFRNNEEGMAGIAGGDLSEGNTGVSLYSLAAVGDGALTLASSADAIINGSISSGYNLEIQNHSWGVRLGQKIYNENLEEVGTYTDEDNELLRQAVKICYENNCLFVGARGNNGDGDLNFPACFQDNLVINVGASGTDGKYHTPYNGDLYYSNFGGNVDLIAPGTTDLVTTAIIPGYATGSACTKADINYCCFSRTSSSAAHVSGVASLMLTRHNTEQGYPNNLSQEDVEFLLQRYSTDISTPAPYEVGYDIYNGHGLLNASATMEKIDLPNYRVFHSGTPTTSTNITSGVTVFVDDYESGLAAGTYYADKYELTHSYTNTFGESTEILDKWERYSSTIGTSAATAIDGETYAEFDYTIIDNTASVVATTFCWHITSVWPFGPSVDVWIPDIPANLKTAYSLHLYDPMGMTVEDEVSKLSNIKIYPNPANENLTINLNKDVFGDAKIIILNMQGAIMQQILINNVSSSQIVDISQLNSGMYFIKVEIGQNRLIQKFIKI